MNSHVIPFPRPHRETIEVTPESESLFWRVTHVQADGQRFSLGDFVDVQSASDFAHRTAFKLGRTRVVVSRGAPR